MKRLCEARQNCGLFALLPDELVREITQQLEPLGCDADDREKWRGVLGMACASQRLLNQLTAVRERYARINWCLLCERWPIIGLLTRECGENYPGHGGCELYEKLEALGQDLLDAEGGLCFYCTATICHQCRRVSCGCVKQNEMICCVCGFHFCNHCFEESRGLEVNECDQCYILSSSDSDTT
jgi:hypothetical protein